MRILPIPQKSMGWGDFLITNFYQQAAAQAQASTPRFEERRTTQRKSRHAGQNQHFLVKIHLFVLCTYSSFPKLDFM